MFREKIYVLNLFGIESYIQGVPKKVQIEKIITKIVCCGAKFSHQNVLGAFDPA